MTNYEQGNQPRFGPGNSSSASAGEKSSGTGRSKTGEKIYCAETQFLIVSGVKGSGIDREGAVVFVDGNVGAGEMKDLGLRPLALFTLVIPSFRIYRRQLVDPRAALSVTAFLQECWSERQGIGLPRYLEMREPVAALDRGFTGWLQALEVDSVTVPTGTKAHIAFEKVASAVGQFECTFALRSHPLQLKLDEANAGLNYYDRFRQQCTSEKSMVIHNQEMFLAREKRYCRASSLPVDCDLRSLVFRTTSKPSPETAISEGDVFHNPPPGLKELLEQWPGGKTRLLSSMGLRAEDLRWWLGLKAHLPEGPRHRLFDFLRIESEDYESDGPDLHYELSGGYLIVAKNQRSMKALYSELSHGGDLRLSFEVLPPDGSIPLNRVMVFANWGNLANIAIFPAEPWVSALLDGKTLINFSGPIRAPSAVWQDVRTILEIQGDLENVARIGAILESRHQGWFDSLEQRHSSRLVGWANQ